MERWSREEKLVKLLNSTQKTLESISRKYDEYLPESVLERAFERSKVHSEKILSLIPNVTEDVQFLSQGLVLGGLYSGFLCGFLKAHLDGGFELPPLKGEEIEADTRFDLIDEFFTHAYQCKPVATMFAVHSASILFTNLKKLPSPLIEGISNEDLGYAEHILKCALYSGFMDGFENAVLGGKVVVDATQINFTDLPFLNNV